MIALKSLTCIKAPGPRPILNQGLLFEQTDDKYLSSSSLRFLKEDFLTFYYIDMGKTMTPMGRDQF
jgi:hypothetical protein